VKGRFDENLPKIKKVIIASIIIILLVSPIAATIKCYETKVNASNSKITLLSTQVANQNSEIADLESQITQFNSEAANISTHLNVSEVTNGTSPSQPVYFNGILAYNALSINGTVTNTGNLTGYDVGLKVIAYSADGTLEINITVPLVYGTSGWGIGADIIYYGTDNATQAYANTENNGHNNRASLQLGNLGGGQTVPVDIEIIHEGTVANWTVTTVWINSS
jgi:outer membrane murein-binding lipoprotein Lpp